MIKKNDLVKQFELITKQEIINHNVQLSQTNQAINDLNTQVAELKQELGLLKEKERNTFAKAEKLEKELAIAFQGNERFYEKCKIAFHNHQDKMMVEMKLALENAVDANSKAESVKNYLNGVAQTLEDFKDEILGFHEIFRDELKHMERRSLSEIKKATKEILEMPSEAVKFKEALERKLEEKAIDAEGYLKELQILKKELFIHDKKLENVYTLIERLKKATT